MAACDEIVIGPQKEHDRGLKTLVLDLDETLVHSSFTPIEAPDLILPVEIEGSICNVYVSHLCQSITQFCSPAEGIEAARGRRISQATCFILRNYHIHC